MDLAEARAKRAAARLADDSMALALAALLLLGLWHYWTDGR